MSTVCVCVCVCTDHVPGGRVRCVHIDGSSQHSAVAPGPRQPDDGWRHVREGAQGHSHPLGTGLRRRRVPAVRRYRLLQLVAVASSQARACPAAQRRLSHSHTGRQGDHGRINEW